MLSVMAASRVAPTLPARVIPAVLPEVENENMAPGPSLVVPHTALMTLENKATESDSHTLILSRAERVQERVRSSSVEIDYRTVQGQATHFLTLS